MFVFDKTKNIRNATNSLSRIRWVRES